MTIQQYLEGRVFYDEAGQMIFVEKQNGHCQILCDIRGWGHIQNLFTKNGVFRDREAAQFQDDIGIFVTEAIKEKIARDKKEHPFAWVHKRGEE